MIDSQDTGLSGDISPVFNPILGDRAYIVTFRQTDPLYIIDLADPANPSIALTYYNYSYSGLHGFDVKIGTDAEVVLKGVLRIEPDSEFNYGAYGVDRSVMVNDALFYIAGSRVTAAHWVDLANSSPLR